MEKHNQTIWKFVAQIIPEKDTNILIKKGPKNHPKLFKMGGVEVGKPNFPPLVAFPIWPRRFPIWPIPLSPSGPDDFLSLIKPVKSWLPSASERFQQLEIFLPEGRRDAFNMISKTWARYDHNAMITIWSSRDNHYDDMINVIWS